MKKFLMFDFVWLAVLPFGNDGKKEGDIMNRCLERNMRRMR